MDEQFVKQKLILKICVQFFLLNADEEYFERWLP